MSQTKNKNLFYLGLILFLISCDTNPVVTVPNSLTKITIEPSSENCQSGAVKFEIGTDFNENGILDTDEIQSSNYICNGIDGALSLATIIVDTLELNCENGGVKIDLGVDINSDNILDSNEISTTVYVCNRIDENNSLTNLTTELLETNCKNGGIKIESGIDTNGDGILADTEITDTSYECNGIDRNDRYIEYQSNFSIPSEINFYPVESYEIGNPPPSYEGEIPSLKFQFITSQTYNCFNYEIATTQFIMNNELIVRFDSILEYDGCSRAIGPANAFVDLQENINRLVLINGIAIDTYQIDLTDEMVKVNPIVKSFTSVEHSKTFRYPENTFVYSCWTNIDNPEICADFFNILLDSTSIIEYEFDGEGRLPLSYSSDGAKFFSYNNESDYAKAGELLEKYALEKNFLFDNSIRISLQGWNNKDYRSW